MTVTRKNTTPKSNKKFVRTDVLSNGYFVSTIDRSTSEEMKMIDEVLGALTTLIPLGDRPADLSAPGDYETMVFKCDPESGEVLDWTELDFARYGTREAAYLGHEAHVEKWSEHD